MSDQNQIAIANQQTQMQAGTPTNMLEIVSRAALDPNVNVEKMQGLLDVQERMMNKQAEIEFNQDFIAMTAELPRITKTSAIVHSGKTIAKYAKYEDIDQFIRPIMQKWNFAVSYNTQPNGNTIIISATLRHRGGHSITDTIPLAIDASGAKNNVQGVGSTIAYGKRYLIGMLLNLVFEGEDDDGAKAGFTKLTDEQASEIKDLLRETNSDVVKFLELFSAPSVDDMDGRNYTKAMNMLKRKQKEMAV